MTAAEDVLDRFATCAALSTCGTYLSETNHTNQEVQHLRQYQLMLKLNEGTDQNRIEYRRWFFGFDQLLKKTR